MPSNEKVVPASRAVNKVSDLHPNFVNNFWTFVELCLREVFDKSGNEAHQAVQRVRERMNRLSEEAILLMYHNSPIQIAANLAGAANRPLTAKELLAYDNLLNKNRVDRPSRDEVLQAAHINEPPRFVF
jgi:hypothetical protein